MFKTNVFLEEQFFCQYFLVLMYILKKSYCFGCDGFDVPIDLQNKDST